MADDLAALLDALGIGEVALAGCAVGAGIVLHFAARFPERVSALVAMAPATGVPAERHAATLERAAAMEQVGPRGLVDQGFARSYPPEVRHDAEQYRRFRARWLTNDPESFAAINRMLAHATVTEELPRIQCPVLLIAGTHDPLRTPSTVEALARSMPNARFRVLETGHFMATQTPEAVAKEINTFLVS